MSVPSLGMITAAAVVVICGVVAIAAYFLLFSPIPKREVSTETNVKAAAVEATESAATTTTSAFSPPLSRRSSAAVVNPSAAESDYVVVSPRHDNNAAPSTTNRRKSFSTEPTSILVPSSGERRQSNLTNNNNNVSPPSLSKPNSFRNSGEAKVVSFDIPKPAAVVVAAAAAVQQSIPSTVSTTTTTTTTLFPLATPVDLLEGHFDSVESVAYSQQEGWLASGGGPEDGFVRFYNKPVGNQFLGSLRHVINVKADCGKFDTASSLSFAFDEGKKSTLLLVGTKVERFLMGYKISKSANTLPINVFKFPTHHAGPITNCVGFVPKTAMNYADTGVFFCTMSLGTREVKVWSAKGGHPLVVIDSECWTSQLRLSEDGKRLAILSYGQGPGQLYELKQDSHHHIKAVNLKLPLPITAESTSTTSTGFVPPKRGEVQGCQDLVFHSSENNSFTALCVRPDFTMWIGSARCPGPAQWDLEVLLRLEEFTSPCQLALLVEGNKQTRAIVARGKHVFFVDHKLAVLKMLEGRREDGEVIGLALNPTHDLLVVVSFGGSVGRVVQVL